MTQKGNLVVMIGVLESRMGKTLSVEEIEQLHRKKISELTSIYDDVSRRYRRFRGKSISIGKRKHRRKPRRK